jgi:hypothetical protein
VLDQAVAEAVAAALGKAAKVPANRLVDGKTEQQLKIDIAVVRRPKTRPVHELERYMRCKDCSEVRGYPYKRSYLVALRATKITASDPPSTWWPGER